MSDRSINEQLREEAERQGLLEPVGGVPEGESETSISAPSGLQPVTPLMIAVTTALDLVGVLVLLTVNIVAGVVVLALSAAVLAIWLSLRLGAMKRLAMKERERARASR